MTNRMVRIVEDVLGVVADPDFRPGLTNGRNHGFPKIPLIPPCFFHPANVNTFERLNLGRVVLNSVEH